VRERFSWLMRLMLLVVAAATLHPARAEPGTGDWTVDGRTYDGQRFSPLTHINEHNVSHLGLQWFYDLDTLRGVEATPLAVDGVLYDISAWDITYAFDVKSGKLLWSYDPQVPMGSLRVL
jgi:quinohemoprotein ethanol dehydrogenase